MPVYAMERQDLIGRLVTEDGRVSVIDLAHRFGVTTETVRRDLGSLERTGAVRRVHGGAVALERSSTVEPSFAERSTRGGLAKAAIARRALGVLGPRFEGSVFLDAGTTTQALAEALPRHLGETQGTAEVVTHSLTIAPLLAGASGIALSVVGGRVRGLTAATVGADTVHAIEALRPDIAFLGANGVSPLFGASTPDPDEAAVKSAIVRAARRVVLLVDADKFGRELLVSFASWAQIDVVVSDVAPSAEFARALDESDTEVWTA